jgi:AraC family transcriptional regulator of adaptative response / DNA-3-methyladenine glycosylase II
VLGQQIRVGSATQVAGRLARILGEPLATGSMREGLRTFPTPAAFAGCDPAVLGMPASRGAALKALGVALSRDPEALRARETLDQTIEHLMTFPGVGPWTAHYIAMRALGETDAFPATDLGLLRAMASPSGRRPSPDVLARRARAWSPWRAYAAMRLWLAKAPPVSQFALGQTARLRNRS